MALRGFVDKAARLRKIISANGGIIASAKTLFITDELKVGDLVGKDKFGNKYYENYENFLGRDRWVVFSKDAFLNYDASQIPPEWHRWMCHITDDPPTKVPLTPRKFIVDHVENMTGTSQAYTPYSTVPPKVTAWHPGMQARKQ